MDRQSAQSIINRIQPNLAEDVLVLAENLSEFPVEVARDAKLNGYRSEQVKAVYFEGTIYLNREAITGEEDLEKSVFEELYGHYGFHQLFGEQNRQRMAELYQAIGGDAGFEQLCQRYDIDLSVYQQRLSELPQQERESILAEELLAHIAAEKAPEKPSIKEKAKAVYGGIRHWLDAHKFKKITQFNDADLTYLLKRAKNAANQAPARPAGTPEQFLMRMVGGNDAPHIDRKIITSDPLVEAWTLLSLNDETFRLPVSKERDIARIFEDLEDQSPPIDPFTLGFQVCDDEDGVLAMQNEHDAEQAWRIETPNGELAALYQRGEEVWIDVSDLTGTGHGQEIYNAVANFAYNNDLVFIGDPAGLSDIAVHRRLENMISSALKFGTTVHLRPHEKQLVGAAGVKPIDWIEGRDSYNLRQMIVASYETMLESFPEIADIHYNVSNGAFEHIQTGDVYEKEHFRRSAENARGGSRDSAASAGNQPGSLLGRGNETSRAGATPTEVPGDWAASQRPASLAELGRGPVRGAASAGSTTIERSILTQTFLRGSGSERRELLEKLGNERNLRLNGILYRLADEAPEQERDRQTQQLLPGVNDNGERLFVNADLQLLGRQQLTLPESDFITGNPLPLGHLANVPEDAEVWEMLAENRDGWPLAELVVQVQQGRISAIHDIKAFAPHQGSSEQVVSAILASSEEPVRAIRTTPDTQAFWDKLGAAAFDPYGNTTLTWSDYEQAKAQRESARNRTGLQSQNQVRPDSSPSLEKSADQPGALGADARSGAEDPLEHSDLAWLDGYLGVERYFQFAGPQAFTADRIALKAARQFERDGQDPEAIRQKTGWFRGEDQKWRFEISDHDATLFETAMFPIGPEHKAFNGKLGDVLDHPNLYAAYPALKDLDVSITLGRKLVEAGSYRPPEETPTGTTGPLLEACAPDMDSLLGCMMHELQHGIQTTEDFALGSNQKFLRIAYFNSIAEREKQLQARSQELKAKEQNHGLSILENRELAVILKERTALAEGITAVNANRWNDAFFEVYQDYAGEREARKTQKDMKLSLEERLERTPFLPERPGRKPLVQIGRGPAIWKAAAAEMELRPRADVTFLPKQSIIRLTQAADRTAFFHEGAHLFLKLEGDTVRGRRPTELQRRILDWLGAESFNHIDRAQHEKFARGFEQYLMDKEPDDQPMSGVFATVKQWFKNIYSSTKELGTPLSKEAKAIFDDMLTTSKEPDPVNLGQARYHEKRLAEQLVESGIYSPEDAQTTARIIGAYALAKAERDPEVPTVDLVFDRMNLKVEAVEEIDTNDDVHFDFETFDVKEIARSQVAEQDPTNPHSMLSDYDLSEMHKAMDAEPTQRRQGAATAPTM